MSNDISSNESKEVNITRRLNDHLIQYFYSFGIDPDSLDINLFTNKKLYLEKDFKIPHLLTKFPPFEQNQSNINPQIVMTHCFPNGYKIISSKDKPKDEFFHFNLDNLLSFSEENNKLYFVCVIIFEPLKSYLNIKYENNIPKLDENIKDKMAIDEIYIPKALCFSSFLCFPHEIKLLLIELLKYTRSNNITLPLEKIMETIVFGIPRPLKAFFYVSCYRNKFIPGQTKDIHFILREFNQYNFNSYPYQSILKFSPDSIMLIFKGLLLEFPILVFCSKKDLLTNIIESFLDLLYPLKYQYPHISILPDSHAGLIEIEKSFFFGINEKFRTEKNSEIPLYFRRMIINNFYHRTFIFADADEGKVKVFCKEYQMYHVVDFDNLGIYKDINITDPTLNVSKDLYTGSSNDLTKDFILPIKYAQKLKSKLEGYIKDNKSQNDYSLNNNIKIGEDSFYYFLASIFKSYHIYLYNTEEEIKIICKYILTTKEEDIEIEKLFKINQFLHDNDNNLFFSKFFKTRIFKNFIIRKYLNLPLEKYIFLHFDETIIKKKNKAFFSKKLKYEFTSSNLFQSTHTYQVKPPNNFTQEETTFIIENKKSLLINYFQNIDENNKINYIIFPKLIYDDKFFQTKYKPSINFLEDQNLISFLKRYQLIENNLKNDKYEDFFDIYNGAFTNRYQIKINNLIYQQELINQLYETWILVFCMTFYYCDEKEKQYRFEVLMKFLTEFKDNQENILQILLVTINRYGDENMMIKLFDIIKKLNYSEYSCLCNKFKSNTKLKKEIRNIVIDSSKLEIFYYKDPNIDENKLSEIRFLDYDINSFKKRTIYTSNQNNNNSDEIKITFDIFYKCQNCDYKGQITQLVTSLNSKNKRDVMCCSNCKKILKVVNYAVYGMKKDEFLVYFPKQLLKVAKDIIIENGLNINMDELRNKYNTFFWNCILYFYHNSMNYEMLLKYRPDEVKVVNKRKVFKILEFENQNTNV